MVRFQLNAPAFIAQSVVEIYPACKDLFLHVKAQGRDIKKLEDRLSELIALMASIMSRKDEIERFLSNSVFSEKTKEFVILETIIAAIASKCTEFTNKYMKITRRCLTPSADAHCIIEELKNLRSNVLTLNFLKLAKLSRDIFKMSTHACEILERLNPDHMICKRMLELNQERFDVDGDDLAFYNAYVDEVLKHLCENEGRVGILGGLGKTIVLKKLFNRLLELRSLCSDNGLELDFVLWLEYPQKKEEEEEEEEVVEKLQNEIMGQLNIGHEASTSVHVNGDKISTFLRRRKYVLLMDEVLSNIDLGRVGLREHHEFKKLVVASSDRNVMSLMVECVFEI